MKTCSRLLTGLLMLLVTGSLFSGIEQYFKKPKDTAGNHSMKNIDFIYTINLDRRPEKFAQCVKQLEPYDIHPYRFSAVNGWELTYDALQQLSLKYDPATMTPGIMGTYYLEENKGQPTHEKISVAGRSYFSHCMPKGAVGIVLSHLSILQHAFDSGFQTIWVMEDDVEVLQDPRMLSTLITKLDEQVGARNWDILFTDRDTKNQKGENVPCTSYAKRPDFQPPHPERFAARKDISADFRQIGARYGAYSMIIRRSGMKKILNFIKTHKIFLPYDMEFYLPGDMRLFTVQKDVVSTLIKALSDNGAPNYLHK